MRSLQHEARASAALTWVRRHVSAIDPDSAGIALRPVLSWGGFVNDSFHITHGSRRYHLKLVPAGETAGIETWQRVHDRLTARYGAPRMLAWGTEPETGGFAALFEHLDGVSSRALPPRVVERVVRLVADLHSDRELARQLSGSPSCVDHYLENHDRRFREDLEGIRAEPPPFVTDGDLDSMEREADRLSRRVRASSAFAEPADSPVHGDLWTENLLVTDRGVVHVLDWDDLRLGDPVLDYATLLGPSPGDVRPADPGALPHGLSLAGSELERLPLYGQATLLDWVIDPLADWTAVVGTGHDENEVRTEKARVHRAAWSLYRARYLEGGGGRS